MKLRAQNFVLGLSAALCFVDSFLGLDPVSGSRQCKTHGVGGIDTHVSKGARRGAPTSLGGFDEAQDDISQSSVTFWV